MKRTFLLVTAVTISSYLQAQQDSAGKTLDEVTVTASKYQQKVLETGKVTNIINRSAIEKSLGKDLSQLLTEQAGVVINGAYSNPGKDKTVFLRGASANYTMILINGVPVNDPSFSGAFDLRLIPLEQIERIEIIKGAQSTLYGSEAVAGVINIITRNGGQKPVQLYGSVAAGSFATKKLNAGIGGATEKISYNIGYTHTETNGVSEALDTTTTKSFDKDGFLQNAFTLNFKGEVVKGLFIKPFFRYTFFKGDYDDGGYADAANQYTSSQLTGGTAAEWKYKQGAVHASYSYDELEREYKSTWGNYPYNGTNKQLELYSYYNASDKVKLLLGFDNRRQKNLDSTATITAVYASVFVKNINGFYLEAGGRYNNHSEYGNNLTYSFNPSYVLNKQVKFFASAASAFRAPSISSLYGSFGANRNLEPEKSQTFEAGIQSSLIDNKIELRAVGFIRHIKDAIIYTNKYVNLDKQDDKGFELEPTVTFNKNINLKIYYAFVTGEVTTKSGAKDTSYNNLLRRPKHSFGATLNYQITKNLFFSTGINSYSKRSDMDFSTWPASAVTLKSYMLWNAYAEYKLYKNNLKVFADAKNLLNKKFTEVYGYNSMPINLTAGLSLSL